MSRPVLHLVRPGRSAPPEPGDQVVAITRSGEFFAKPAGGGPPQPIDSQSVIAMLFESDGVIVW